MADEKIQKFLEELKDTEYCITVGIVNDGEEKIVWRKSLSTMQIGDSLTTMGMRVALACYQALGFTRSAPSDMTWRLYSIPHAPGEKFELLKKSDNAILPEQELSPLGG